MHETWNGFLDLLYPPKCLLCDMCGRPPLCAVCRTDFLPVPGPLCTRCGLTSRDALCPDCAGSAPYYFAAARAAGRFNGALRQAILRLKYDGKRALAAPLGSYLGEWLSTGPFLPSRFDLLVPVPLHPSRERERGFNQAALLAREAGRMLELPVEERALRRIRRTRPQVSLPASQRAVNIRDAFVVRDAALVKGKAILLIDDVLTTLHTTDECARVLVNAGAKVVLVAGLARGA